MASSTSTDPVWIMSKSILWLPPNALPTATRCMSIGDFFIFKLLHQLLQTATGGIFIASAGLNYAFPMKTLRASPGNRFARRGSVAGFAGPTRAKHRERCAGYPPERPDDSGGPLQRVP